MIAADAREGLGGAFRAPEAQKQPPHASYTLLNPFNRPFGAEAAPSGREVGDNG